MVQELNNAVVSVMAWPSRKHRASALNGVAVTSCERRWGRVSERPRGIGRFCGGDNTSNLQRDI